MDSRFIGPGENPFSERNPDSAKRYKELHDAGQARKRQLEARMRELGMPVKDAPGSGAGGASSNPIMVRRPNHMGRRNR